jgi:hypothetical protein
MVRAPKTKKKGKNNFSDLIKEEEKEGPAVIDTQFFSLWFFSGFCQAPARVFGEM